MSIDNRSDTTREARVRRLAVMDWAGLPSRAIREEFGAESYVTICSYRRDPAYIEVVEQLRKEWMEEMIRLPSTSDLRKKISQGMNLSVNVLIEILAGKAAYKDKISAARLMSQLDGRFLRSGEEEGIPAEGRESVAEELLRHIGRVQ